MDQLHSLLMTRDRLVKEIVSLGDMRRGSVVEQFVDSKLKDGTKVKRGPYWLYSHKQDGKTLSRRLPDADMAAKYQAHIGEFRRFTELCQQLLDVNHEICDMKMGLCEPKGDPR